MTGYIIGNMVKPAIIYTGNVSLIPGQQFGRVKCWMSAVRTGLGV